MSDPTRRNRIINDAIQEVFGKPPPKTELDVLFERATQINVEVREQLQREYQLSLMTKQDAMKRAVELYVAAIGAKHWSHEDLLFLLAFNCAKILTDQI